MNFLRIILFPLALLYGLITLLRNKFFDWGILPSNSYPHPIIGIGNLSTGGTGKTPHIEYLISLLKQKYSVATISRGYKRKTRGYLEVNARSTVKQVGDEPLQMCLKHPDILVTVSESRNKAIKRIKDQHPKNQVILLDDSFQHRYVKPGLNILLTDYHKIFTKNYVLPTGNLREFRMGAKRSDILIVTKTPSVFSPLDRKLILKDLEKYGIKNIFFSYIKYGKWMPVTNFARTEKLQKAKTIFLITGIANPIPLGEYLKRLCTDLKVFQFADHHQFTEKELSEFVNKYHETYSGSKAIVTTEKDSMRLRSPGLSRILTNLPVYYVPIEVEFHQEDKKHFDNLVVDYVEKHYGYTIRSKGKESGKKLHQNKFAGLTASDI